MTEQFLTKTGLLAAHGLYGAAKILSLLFVLIFLCELFSGSDLRRYLSRNFRTDMLYAFLYRGGLYDVLISGPIIGLVALAAPVWDLRLFERLPLVPGFLLFWLSADFIGYWIHRWQHQSKVLWLFHSVHHAQTRMTFVTSYRIHVVEQLLTSLLMYLPLMIIGAPKWYWAPAYILQNLFEAVQHADLDWRYGRLYPVLVSPVFHAIHHTPERDRHDSNYGKILSVWDRLFGTLSSGPRPSRYGLADIQMPDGFWGTVAAPFRQARMLVVSRQRRASLPLASDAKPNF